MGHFERQSPCYFLLYLQYTRLCCGPTDKQRRCALCPPSRVPFIEILAKKSFLGTIPSNLYTTALTCSQNLAQTYIHCRQFHQWQHSTAAVTPFNNVLAVTVKQANSECCNLSQLICTTPTIRTPYTSKEQPALQDHRNNFIPSFLATPPPT